MFTESGMQYYMYMVPQWSDRMVLTGVTEKKNKKIKNIIEQCAKPSDS